MKNLIPIFVTIAVLALISSAAAQMTVTGEVVDVLDGKTVVIAAPSGRVTAELQSIEVPEPGQQLHEIVKEHLSRLVLGKKVMYRALALLRDRTVGRLLLNEVDISQQMLRDGAAWQAPSAISGQAESSDAYTLAETDAKREKRGVWSIVGMRPPWELRALKQAPSAPAPSVTDEARPAPPKPDRPRSKWGDRNPGLGNVGALANGYNAATKSGYIGTSLLVVTDPDPEKTNGASTALDVTYFYKEAAQNKRQGVFVVTVASISAKWRFLERNDLIVICDGKRTVVPKPKRTTSNDGGTYRENLAFQVDRELLEKITNGNEVYLKVGDYAIRPTPGVQMLLYNLLQVTE
jgi:endonuclease YncB( thermonuclease family)